jgi:hypothetical protein
MTVPPPAIPLLLKIAPEQRHIFQVGAEENIEGI